MIVTCRVKRDNERYVEYLRKKNINISRYVEKCLVKLANEVVVEPELFNQNF